MPLFTPFDDRLKVVNSFRYLGCLIAHGEGDEEDAASRITKARVAFANLHPFRHRYDIKLSLIGEVHNATVCGVFYGC